MTARWYVVNVYSGSEKKAAESIREQSVLKKMEDKILEGLHFNMVIHFQIMIPSR